MVKKNFLRGETNSLNIEAYDKFYSTIQSTSNVGILKSNPTCPLDVNGNVACTGNLLVDGVPITQFDDPFWQASGSDIYFNTGNVSIGTSSSVSNLTVGGNMKVSSNLSSDQSFNISSSSDTFKIGSNISGNGVVTIGHDSQNNNGGILVGSNSFNTGLICYGNNSKTLGSNSIVFGHNSGLNDSGENVILIGQRCGSTTPNSSKYFVGIGSDTQQLGAGNYSVGFGSDTNSTGENSVAFGYEAHSFGNNSVAFGSASKSNTNSLCVGYKAGYSLCHENVVILNSTGDDLPSDKSNASFIKKIRGEYHGIGVNKLHYDTATRELTYSLD